MIGYSYDYDFGIYSFSEGSPKRSSVSSTDQIHSSSVNDTPKLTEDQVWSFLDKHPQLIDKWLKDKLSDEVRLINNIICF